MPSPTPDQDQDPDADTNLMAQMGFSIFGHQKKKSQPTKPTQQQQQQHHSPPPNRTPKRQKHTHKHASGANNTPLSTRQSTTNLSTTHPTESTKSVAENAASAAGDADPRYEDSEPEELGEPENPGSPADSAPHVLEGELVFRQEGGVAASVESGGNGVRWPPPVQRLGNGDCAFFRASFVVEDPWEGMEAVRLA